MRPMTASYGRRLNDFASWAEKTFTQPRVRDLVYGKPVHGPVKVRAGSHPCDACHSRGVVFLFPVQADGQGPVMWIGEDCLGRLKAMGLLLPVDDITEERP